MVVNKIRQLILSLFFTPILAFSNEKIEIKPYAMPTFTGETVNWHKIKPAINPLPEMDGDYIFEAVRNCYPIKPWGVEVSLKAGANYRDSVQNEIATSDSSKYYAGIVFNMPLYSGTEVEKERDREYKRRIKTADTIASLIKAVAKKRRAERLMGLYLSLEKRSQERVKQGIVSVDEQIGYLEKVAKTQADYDQALADIEGERISLVAQCRPDVSERVNTLILQEIGKK